MKNCAAFKGKDMPSLSGYIEVSIEGVVLLDPMEQMQHQRID
jgi:hypothetical protein